MKQRLVRWVVQKLYDNLGWDPHMDLDAYIALVLEADGM